mmetsp:Transcript_39933/g.123396  ORF Transcript_39933/g.123396 Transcript_39933/m.123396 type:complete len:128 (-) Transcript_39933:69-452(-)
MLRRSTFSFCDAPATTGTKAVVEKTLGKVPAVSRKILLPPSETRKRSAQVMARWAPKCVPKTMNDTVTFLNKSRVGLFMPITEPMLARSLTAPKPAGRTAKVGPINVHKHDKPPVVKTDWKVDPHMK